MKRLEMHIGFRIFFIIINFFIFIILGILMLYQYIIVMNGDPPPSELELEFYRKSMTLFILSIVMGILFIIFTKTSQHQKNEN